MSNGAFGFVRVGTLIVTAFAIAAAFSGDGVAAPFTNPNASGPGDNLGVVPLARAPGGSGALALAALDRRIADLDAEETSAKRELSEMAAKIAEAHGRSMNRGRAFYRLTRAGMLPVGGGFDALVTHALRVERARRALAVDLEAEKKLRARGGDLSRTLERIARDRVAYGSQRTSMDAARLAVEDEARRTAAFDRAFSQSTGASDFVAVGGGNGTGQDGRASTGFALSKGRLLFPIVGRTEVRAAQREGTTGPGLEIRAGLGAGVRATHAGRVAFAERYGPYGRLVIIDHGDHYFTVSANLAALHVKVGDEVSAGERIGSVGDEGKGAMLYFEVRHGTETMAPGPWLGI